MKFVRGVWKQLQNICVADEQYDQHQEGETCRESHGTVGCHRMLGERGLNGLNRLQLFTIDWHVRLSIDAETYQPRSRMKSVRTLSE